MFFDSLVLNIVIVWLGAGVVGWVLRLLIFQASWALNDLPEQSLGRVLAVATPLWLLAWPFGLGLDHYVFRKFTSTGAINLPRVLGLTVSVATVGVVAGVVYVVVLRAGVRKGALTALFESVLTLFAVALVAALVFVVLALVQAVR